MPASICTFVRAVPAHCLRLQLISVSFLFLRQYLYFCASSAFALRTTYASSVVSASVRTNEKKMCQYLYFCTSSACLRTPCASSSSVPFFFCKETHALKAVVAPKASDLKEAVGAFELLLNYYQIKETVGLHLCANSGAPPEAPACEPR